MEETADMASQETETQVSVRLPKDMLERAEALVASLRQNPDNVLLGLSRATVLRLALQRGLAVLEEETQSKAKAAK